MSPRALFFILFAVPVLGKGGSSHGGHSGHVGGHVSHGTHATGHQAATYPHSTGLSGNNRSPQGATYPHSTDLSGNNRSPQGNTHTHHTTEVHHHHYSPPQRMQYGSHDHPVYHGTPPVYVYQYRDSGSRYNSLLTGLALYNLGTMSAHHDRHYPSDYTSRPGEVCKMQISKANGEFEETRIDCKLMSSFIWDFERERAGSAVVATNKNVVTTVNVTQVQTSDHGTNVVTTTQQNITVVNALDVKGPAIQVTPNMSCYMIRISRDSSILKKKVECGLLQAYAHNSFRNQSWQNKPIAVFTMLVSSVLLCLF